MELGLCDENDEPNPITVDFLTIFVYCGDAQELTIGGYGIVPYLYSTSMLDRNQSIGVLGKWFLYCIWEVPKAWVVNFLDSRL